MPLYRCYFVSDDYTTTVSLTFYKSSDGAAHGHALDLFASNPLASKIEVWEGTRLILTYVRPKVETSQELRRLSALAADAAKKESDPQIRKSIAAYAAKLAQEAEAMEWGLLR